MLSTSPSPAGAAALAAAAQAPAPNTRGATPRVRRAALLARRLSYALMVNVQRTTAMNLSAAKLLLSHARLPVPADAQRMEDTWRMSWRSFEICATSCDEMLQLAQAHSTRGHNAIWQALELAQAEAAQLSQQGLRRVRGAFEQLAAAQSQQGEALRAVLSEVLALAQAPAPSAAQAQGEEPSHGTH